MKDPAYRGEYDALEAEFAIASALIRARADAGLTQAELAERMGTKQEVIARSEGGGTALNAHPRAVGEGDRGPAANQLCAVWRDSEVSRSDPEIDRLPDSGAVTAARGRTVGVSKISEHAHLCQYGDRQQ